MRLPSCVSIDIQIQEKLASLEQEHGFRILFAAEAGSRAWGFASADSDYDVRFVYVWPKDRYLSIELPLETIDHAIDENDIDLSGWELRKALVLFRKSNGALLEWLFSPISYRADSEVLSQWRQMVLEQGQYVPKRSAAHYLGLAKGMWLRMEKEPEKITAKRYLYLMRSLLAARHVVDFREVPQVPFTELMNRVHLADDFVEALQKMIALKASGSESDQIERVQILDQLVAAEMPAIDSEITDMEGETLPVERLDQFFNDVLER